MADVNDRDLVREFADSKSESAFAALVRQHINLVFATALRQVGDRTAAEEITQSVFVALAQSAGKLGSHPTIAGWLHQTALNKSREWLRSELRRRRREQIAVELAEARAEGDSIWSPLVPLLDEALLQLRDADRAAVILHFMEGRTFSEVGSILGVGEDTARKRVDRCLEQLTKFFQRRGFTVPTLSATAPLFVLASHTAPTELASSAISAGLAAHSTLATTLTLKGALKIMAWTKMKMVIIASVLVIVAGTAIVLIQKQKSKNQYTVVQAPWSDVGAKTPKDALQTLAWAVTHNQIERAQELIQWNENGVEFLTNKTDRVLEQEGLLRTALAPSVNNIESIKILSIRRTGQSDELLVTFVKTFKNKRIEPFAVTAKLQGVGSQWHVAANIEYYENGNISLTLPFSGSFE